MAQFSVKIMRLTGSVLGENQQDRKHTRHSRHTRRGPSQVCGGFAFG